MLCLVFLGKKGGKHALHCISGKKGGANAPCAPTPLLSILVVFRMMVKLRRLESVPRLRYFLAIESLPTLS